MNMIRWGGLITFIIITGLIALFTVVFLDTIIERSIEDKASTVVGARVDIGSLDVGIFDLSIAIHDIAITNPDEPMRNIIETGDISFDLAAAPLLRKKVVIERLAVQDIALNTPRKTSGALPHLLEKKKREARRIPVKGEQDKCVLPDFSMLTDLREKTPEELLDGAALKSSEFLASHSKKVADARRVWEEKLEQLPTKESIEADIKALKSIVDKRPDDITKLPAYLDRVNRIRKRLTETRDLLVTARKDFQSDISNLKGSLAPKEIENLKANDLRSVMANLDIESPSSEGLVCVILGKKLTRMVTRALAWYGRLSDFIPAGRSPDTRKGQDRTPRMEGIDVSFPTTGSYPDLLVERADFSARPAQEADPRELSFSRLSGTIEGFTTQPAIYGKPLGIDVAGTLAAGAARDVSLQGTIDRRTEVVDDSFSLAVRDFRVRPDGATALDTSSLRLSAASIDAQSDVRVTGETVDGRVSLTVANPVFDVGPEAAILQNVFEGIGTFDITLALGGTLDNVSLSVSSSLADMLRQKLRKVVQNQLGDIETKLKDIIASRIHDNIIQSIGDTDSLETVILNRLTERMTLIDRTPQARDTSDTSREPIDLLKKGLPLPF